MPVWKYRDIADMPPPPRAIGPENVVRRIRALWSRTARCARLGRPPGIRKYHSIQEAQEEDSREPRVLCQNPSVVSEPL
jgi:radical SAM superfamily enzyme with C-terminal helix-hairpin-helix motif